MNSTERWDDVPRGTMDEVSSSVRLDLPLKSDGKAALQIVPPRLRIPCRKGRGADSEEKHEPASDIDTVVVDSLKALDPNGRLEKRTARLDSGQLWVCTAPNSGRPNIVRIGLRTLVGRETDQELNAFEVEELWAEPSTARVNVSTDGEVSIMDAPLHLQNSAPCARPNCADATPQRRSFHQ